MFDKILIANRGEIACRVIDTARRLGISTVAVCSDPDRTARHVDMADEAIRLGGAAAADSYLNQAAIIKAALDSGAQAIHPGYGFLSENPDFVQACDENNLVFIGPSASAIRAMGLKDAAKLLMQQADVPVVPGYHGEEQDEAFLSGQAEQVGYPVLIKARAGGGGKGMRKVGQPADFKDALASARREAASSFGDDRVLIEKFVACPRHIEVQVFGDSHGNVVYLFERDCSLQRRHQKVIEEAPAPDMPEAMRRAMGEAAVRAAQAVNYSGAGTVEFIVDASHGLKPDAFYFMEMNTRLQVEHPVTEAITGQDLVEWQLRVANGEPLPMQQQELTINGHAFEARIYAEDADNGFLPATGTLEYLSLCNTARRDTGVRQGDQISAFYDPMIAKLIVHGDSRETALKLLTHSLGNSHVAGCTTNIGFLHRLSRHPRFVCGDVDTGLIEENMDNLARDKRPGDEVIIAGALALSGRGSQQHNTDPWSTLHGWRHFGDATRFVHLKLADEEIDVLLKADAYQSISATIGERVIAVRLLYQHQNELKVEIDQQIYQPAYALGDEKVSVFSQGETWVLQVNNPLSFVADEGAAEDVIRAPMPGQIIELRTEVGASVTAGDTLAVMEAMKMEQALTAPRDGVVEAVDCATGDQVEEGTVLIRLKGS